MKVLAAKLSKSFVKEITETLKEKKKKKKLQYHPGSFEEEKEKSKMWLINAWIYILQTDLDTS